MLTWLVGWLWWLVLPIRKAQAVAAYRRCFPGRDPGELRRGVGEVVSSYLHLALGIRSRVEGVELLEQAGGGIVLCGHGAAWDMTLISLGERFPTTIFVKRPSNEWVADWITGARQRAGIELLAPSGSMKQAYRSLEAGRAVLFVQDQRYNDGIAVPFFGRGALTSPGLAAMAWRTKAPIFGMWQWREGWRHRTRIERLDWPVPADRDQAIAELTARTQRWYEQAIATAPWAWLWLHERWRGAPEQVPDPLAEEHLPPVG